MIDGTISLTTDCRGDGNVAYEQPHPPAVLNPNISKRATEMMGAVAPVIGALNASATATDNAHANVNVNENAAIGSGCGSHSAIQNGTGAVPLPSWVSSHSSGLSLDPYSVALFQGFLSHSTNTQTHNLIPIHLQADAIATTLNGTPGYQPALIVNAAQGQANHDSQGAMTQPPPYSVGVGPSSLPVIMPVFTVQDRPMLPPVYNGVNPLYPGLRLLNSNPPMFVVDNFLTPFECQFLIHSATDCFGPAPVVGKGSGEISPSRTSSTCYLAREDLPDYLRKVSLLTGKPVEHCELPQVGRYFPSEQYLQHFDAFDLSNEDGRRFAANGGQRTVTVLVYLNHVNQGGATLFPAINLQVQPRQGMAVVFFPATVDGLLDRMALHAALPAIETKYVSQVWIRQGEYCGQPSKRLPHTLGVPFGQQQQQQQQQPLHVAMPPATQAPGF